MFDDKVLHGAETEIIQIGVVVENLDQTIDSLTSLGLGPFKVHTATHTAAIFRGKKVSYQVKIAMSQQGSVQLELIEYLYGNTIHNEFLQEKGEGLHHICLRVNDIDGSLHRFEQKGISVAQQDRFVGGGGVAYMDDEKTGGITFEVVQLPPDYDPAKGVKYRPD
jgi:catechol 2,3-dioxygenase-like lactoylglutathione lyase family enzyme